MIYFPEPYDHSKNEIKIALDLSNHATNLTYKMREVSIRQILLKRLI